MAEDVLYNWTGTNRSGKKISGEMKAGSPTSVKAALRKQGITAKSVKKQGKSLFSMGAKITPADVAIFTRQLATMMMSGSCLKNERSASANVNPTFALTGH